MTKTIEEQIKEIKHCAECAVRNMKDHKRTCFKDDGSFDSVINDMHNAQNKNLLSEAYYKYINLCICHGYSDGYIIGGIMQNDAKNKEFNVNIDSVIKSLIEIKYNTVKLSDPVVTVKEEKPTETKNEVKEEKPVKQEAAAKNMDESVGGAKYADKLSNKIHNKINYINNLIKKVENNQSDNREADIEKIKSTCEETRQMILAINPTSCTEENIDSLNDANAAVNEIVKKVETFEAKNSSENKSIPVQQPAAAQSITGFNIGNFIKDNKTTPVANPDNKANAKPQQPPKTAFPHKICGLTDDQIVEEVGKHFRVNENLPAYPLYDLINNRLLTRKMKELDAKQRTNNPYLTQVNINDYIDVPELLEKYTLCFTMPCNDKKQIIVVLFNPTAVPDKNGVLQYPIHIFKAAKVNDNK